MHENVIFCYSGTGNCLNLAKNIAKVITMDKKEKELSKFLSLILRHKPETIGIKLDEHGWAVCILIMVCASVLFKVLVTSIV